jgi:protein-disulfide isomerase
VKTGLLQIAFRQLPLVKIHANAQRAAEVAICAQQQGLFSDIHEMLFSNPNGLSEADLSGAVLKIEAAGINYQRCAASAAGQIQRDIQLAKDLGVSGTPTFFIGNVESGGVKVREVIAGARPLSDFTAAIEAARAGDRN